MHPARFCFTPLMIVAAKMQNAVDQEHRQLFGQRPVALFGLTGCGRHSDYHVTKQV
jgi:hypothetical protein